MGCRNCPRRACLPGEGLLLRFLAAAFAAATAALSVSSIGESAHAAQGIEAGEDAIILEERLEIEIRSATSATVRFFNRTQILTARGVEDHAKASVYYYPGVRIKDLRGAVIPPSGKRVEVKRADILDGAVFASFELYSDARHRTIYFPGAVPQSTVEHSYELEVENLFYLPHEFDLQETIPARSKTLTVQAPAGFPMRMVAVGGSPTHERQEREGMTTHRWGVQNVPALKREEGMPPPEDLIPRVLIVPIKTVWGEHLIDASAWDGIARFYWELARDRMEPAPEVASKARELAGALADTDERTRRLYEFVQGSVSYVAISLGIGGWQPHPSRDVLHLMYGDCKDKATLLIAMLRALGVEGFPVLLRTRSAGLIEAAAPGLFFNHAIVALPRGDGYLFLDPTSKHTPFGDLPWTDQGVPVLVVRGGGTGVLIETPLTPADRNRRHLSVSGSIGRSGTLEGTLTIDSIGQQQEELAHLGSSKPTERLDALEELLSEQVPGAQMSSHELILPTRPGEALRVILHFSIPGFVRRAGSLEVFSPHVTRFADLSPLAAYLGRSHPIFFPYLFAESVEARLRLPEGRTLKKIPQPRKLEAPGLDAESHYEVVREGGQNVLLIRRLLTAHRRDIPASEYPALRALLLSLAEEEAAAVTLQPE